MKFQSLAAATLALACAFPAAAQDDVARRSYPFVANHLRIEVQTPLAGSIHIVRGGRIRLEVAARVPSGLAAFGLDDRTGEVLRLTATGSGSADFIITVPEGVAVNLALPGSDDLVSIGLGDAAPQRWNAQGAPAPAPQPPAPAAAVRVGMAAGPIGIQDATDRAHPAPTFVAERAPHVVSIPDADNVRSVSVRIEGSDFRVGSSVPLRTIPGNAERLEIRTAGPPIDLVLHLPEDVAGFMLKVGSEVAFAVNAGEARALCSPVVAQTASSGGRWFDFTPRDGRLHCQP